MIKLSPLAVFMGVALSPLVARAADPAQVVATYAEIAAAKYEDSLNSAEALQGAVQALIAAPSESSLQAARSAWLAARVPYQQTEVYRFGNPLVDDWEGRVNSWPLDEGLIDSVAGDTARSEDNDLAQLNVIATPKFSLSGREIDASVITPELLADVLHEADGIEANVATGYHAIEFLLWGQDLNGTGPGAGNRPYTDYVTGEGCSGGNCDRRAAYLQAASDLLVTDLQEMLANWQEGGAAREAVTADPQAGLVAMVTGMGSLSYGELAGERMKLGLMLNDPEEEHDCFSDNTHNSHYYDGLGIRDAYLGSYTRTDGSQVSGASLADLVAAADPEVDARLKSELAASVAALGAVKAAAEAGLAYDQMIAPGNLEGEKLLGDAIAALVTQTGSIERAVAVLGLSKIDFEGSDSLDSPEAVFR
ncbi:imelysin family protein [Pseudogemmobacter faecipullorum]|uniref:Peptidase n=1 Tax=Pseudogemmobacter faecipullorum TaxID=2755041 RepID=A0ABS8CLX0_9RHOB|nr:imelysin family protein [Pseudogemmobacter faecipullorum]MCB5410387.1 peptidase [Pseudogemmobacter faecipullorum]